MTKSGRATLIFLKQAETDTTQGGLPWPRPISSLPIALGASGTKLMTMLVNALKQRNKRYGLQTMCEGAGMANVTIVERL